MQLLGRYNWYIANNYINTNPHAYVNFSRKQINRN